jgi:hypothetical protein
MRLQMGMLQNYRSLGPLYSEVMFMTISSPFSKKGRTKHKRKNQATTTSWTLVWWCYGGFTFLVGRGRPLKKITLESASEENTALSQSSASGSGRTTRPCRLKKRQTDVVEINRIFAGVNPDVCLKQKKKKRRKEAALEELSKTSFSDGHSAAEVGTLARNDTPPRNNKSCAVTPSTTRRKSDSTMDLVLTQLKSVTSKK